MRLAPQAPPDRARGAGPAELGGEIAIGDGHALRHLEQRAPDLDLERRALGEQAQRGCLAACAERRLG